MVRFPDLSPDQAQQLSDWLAAERKSAERSVDVESPVERDGRVLLSMLGMLVELGAEEYRG